MITDLHRIGIKFLTARGDDIPLTDFIPIFHAWIQEGKLEDVMIDVAEYSHVPAGPGTMLIAHEGNYAIDETGNRRGFVYYSKQEVSGDNLADRLAVVCRKNLAACKLLEAEDTFKDRLAFDFGRIEIFFNDRLNGPNSDETWQAFEPVLKSFMARLYPNTDFEARYETGDPRERFSVSVSLQDDAASAEDLLARL
ncbi:hypothetical protein J2T55_002614 [Methylohalomonas lacus]|uniref:Uncharacterized protein n=1 Tax=Methylohalomonas lacus TaxID=398773 RepID=A0AAE3HLK5_9GAMM|nr:hypothetical protein [Methylohalomonas lacus]MCS3904575.1 hypothetical protein [Methylohalomonas lacus]